MEVSLSAFALEDLRNIKGYYLELSVPDVGSNFIAAIFEHIETLTMHPDIGRVVPEFDENHIRELIHPPFRIVYLRGKKSIQIVRVWRSEGLLRLEQDET